MSKSIFTEKASSHRPRGLPASQLSIWYFSAAKTCSGSGLVPDWYSTIEPFLAIGWCYLLPNSGRHLQRFLLAPSMSLPDFNVPTICSNAAGGISGYLRCCEAGLIVLPRETTDFNEVRINVYDMALRGGSRKALLQIVGGDKLIIPFADGAYMNPFKGRHFQRDIILWAVRWYCKYGISYRAAGDAGERGGMSITHDLPLSASVMRLKWKTAALVLA